MPLGHALLVALSEQPSSGVDLAKRFDKSIGYFWNATHQQIYKLLGQMEAKGWLDCTEVAQSDRPTKKVYSVTAAGAAELHEWLSAPTPPDLYRSVLATKLRGATFGDRQAILGEAENALADYRARLAHFEFLAKRDYPEPEALTGLELDQYLVLRGGILMQTALVDWLTEYLDVYDTATDLPTSDRTSDRTEDPA